MASLLAMPLALQAQGWPTEPLGGEQGLFIDEGNIREIRSKIDNCPWAAEAYGDLKQRAARPFPVSSHTKGVGMEVMRMKEQALYWRISGDDKYIPEIVKALLSFYDTDHPDRTYRPCEGKVARNYWQNVMCYDLRYLAAYDLIKEHPLMKPHAQAMEKRLHEAMEYTKYAVRNIHSDSNTTFWTVAGLATYGFYLGDEEAIDIAINGRWGFKHVLGTFREDGRFRPEGATYSYRYVDVCQLIIAELARRCGYPEDLYRWEHPKTGASLHKMALSMLDIAQPDGNLISRGDHTEQIDMRTGGWLSKGGWGMTDKSLFGHPEHHRVSDKAELLYYIFRDPEYAWVLTRSESRGTHCDQFWGMTNLVYGVPELGEVKVPEARSEVFPDMGYAFLKSVKGPAYWEEGTMTATIVSGVKQITHNHRDHFSITLNAFGKYLYNDWYLYWDYLCPRPGRANMTPYSARAIAHNTVSVDFCEPGPAEGKVQWSEIRRESGVQILSLSGSVFEGVQQSRTLCVTPDYVVDVFELQSDTDHNYDWFLHSRGSASYLGLKKWKSYPTLNKEYGFGPVDTAATQRPHNEWLLEPKVATNQKGEFSVLFSDTDGLSVKSTIFVARGAKVLDTATPFYVNLGGWDKPLPDGMPERNPMTVLRQEGKNVSFIAVHQPLKEGVKELKVSLKGGVLTVQGEGFKDEYETVPGIRLRSHVR